MASQVSVKQEDVPFNLDVPDDLREKLNDCNETRIKKTQQLKEKKKKKERLKVEKEQLKEKINEELENQDITVLETKIDNIQDLSEIETFKTILDNLKEIEELIVQFEQYTDYVDNLNINQDLVNQITWDNSENIEEFLKRTVERRDILNDYLGQASMEKLDRQEREEAEEREKQEAEEKEKLEREKQEAAESQEEDEKSESESGSESGSDSEKLSKNQIEIIREREERYKIEELEEKLEKKRKKKGEVEYIKLINVIKEDNKKLEYFKEDFIKKYKDVGRDNYEDIGDFEKDPNVYHKIEILHIFDAVFNHLVEEERLVSELTKTRNSNRNRRKNLKEKLGKKIENYLQKFNESEEAKEKLEEELKKNKGENEEQIKKSKKELEKKEKELKKLQTELIETKKNKDKFDTEQKIKEDEEEEKKAIKKMLEKIKASESWKNGTWIEKSIFSEKQIEFLKEKKEELRLGHVLYLKYSQIRKINQEYIRMGKGLDNDMKGGFGTEQKPKEESSDKIDDDKIKKNINEFFKEKLEYIFDPKEIVQQLSLKEYFEFLKGQY